MFDRPMPAPFGESHGMKCSDVCEAVALAMHVSISALLRRDRRFTHWPPHGPCDARQCFLAGGESFSAPPAHPRSLRVELGVVGAEGHEAVSTPAPSHSLGFPGSHPSCAVPQRAT